MVRAFIYYISTTISDFFKTKRFERYQPVSYNLTTRSGTEAEFFDMVIRCNAVGVRIYVDAVINHMADRQGFGSSGSEYNGIIRSFPKIPYGLIDFNDKKCKTSSGKVENYDDPEQVKLTKNLSFKQS
jgi:alpha-amylase